jgi:hypothetical protein
MLHHGCSIRRLFAIEDPNIALYWISVWCALHLHATIDLVDELKSKDSRRQKPEGFQPDESTALTQISPYLRQQR